MESVYYPLEYDTPHRLLYVRRKLTLNSPHLFPVQRCRSSQFVAFYIQQTSPYETMNGTLIFSWLAACSRVLTCSSRTRPWPVCPAMPSNESLWHSCHVCPTSAKLPSIISSQSHWKFWVIRRIKRRLPAATNYLTLLYRCDSGRPNLSCVQQSMLWPCCQQTAVCAVSTMTRQWQPCRFHLRIIWLIVN